MGSTKTVIGLLEREADVVGYERCILAGFSQGGAMALYVGLQVPHKLAGILYMSAYLPRPTEVVITPQARETPVLQCHGEVDPMVRIDTGRKAEEFLSLHGVHSHKFY